MYIHHKCKYTYISINTVFSTGGYKYSQNIKYDTEETSRVDTANTCDCLVHTLRSYVLAATNRWQSINAAHVNLIQFGH